MTKAEKKIINFFNRIMPWIGIVFTFATGVLLRINAIEYKGEYIHNLLYSELPGNITGVLYRTALDILLSRMDNPIYLVKIVAYLGDLGLLVLFLISSKPSTVVKALKIIAFIWLSPVLVISSVCGMRLDSVCIFLVLLGFYFYEKWINTNKIIYLVIGTLITPISIFIYPQYIILIVIMLSAFGVKYRGTRLCGIVMGIIIGLIVLGLVVDELIMGGRYSFRFLIYDYRNGALYSNFIQWIIGMFFVSIVPIAVICDKKAIIMKKNIAFSVAFNVICAMILGLIYTWRYAVWN